AASPAIATSDWVTPSKNGEPLMTTSLCVDETSGLRVCLDCLPSVTYHEYLTDGRIDLWVPPQTCSWRTTEPAGCLAPCARRSCSSWRISSLPSAASMLPPWTSSPVAPACQSPGSTITLDRRSSYSRR